MANQVVIDVEARFVDNVTGNAKSASKAFNDVEKNAKEAVKEVDNLGKAKATPKVDADNSKALDKLNKTEQKLTKLGKSKTDAKLSILDKASMVIDKVTAKVKSFGNKSYSAILKLRDSNVLSSLSNMSSKIKKFTSKTWSVAVKIKDMATAPLRGIKNMLFSIKSLVLAITAGLAAKQLIINPIGLADQYSSAKIGFSTLLGESAGQQMMNDLDVFAKKTPFNTSNVISNAQKMMAMGWDPESIIGDMEIIGNAAAATGKLDAGLESIVRAMAQIKTKGRLSTEELNQLAEAGISAKSMLAENLGYGTGDEGIAKMTEDLEKGAISSNKAIEALLAGMQKYNGMMDSMANETVEGLGSQIKDAFEINVFRKWGQGLQDGAKRGFGTLVQLLDESEAALSSFGDMLYEIGQKVSNWLADKFQNAVDRILKITDSFEFKNASLGEKLSMLWKGVVADPLSEWWNGGGKEKTAETAGKIGKWMGEMLTKGLLALFGATDILDDGIGKDQGANIAGSFLDGFLGAFDGSAITNAFVDAISNVWGALPWWAKLLIGGYGVGKAAGGISSFAGGVANFIGGAGKAIGGFNIASSAFPILTSSGTGVLGAVGKLGVGLGASTTGTALLAGGLGIAGGVAAGASAIHGGYDLYKAHKAYKSGDKIEGNANAVSGVSSLSGVALGATIGAMFGPIGALVGAGIGGAAGWLLGDKLADDIRAAKYESEEMKKAINDSEMSAEELAETFAKAKWENAKKHFGDIKLSMNEIARLADQIVWGDDLGNFEKFTSATKQAEANLQSLKTASEQTDRWMWKASLGVKFNEDEIESIKASFDDYINAAKSYVENKHYEFTAAVSLLVDTESESGKNIIESANSFYGGLQEQLNDLGSKLSSSVEIALEDGVITLDEQAEIINLQQQIADITQKVANAEQQAQIELIKVKFGKGNLDYESFESFMSTMQTTIDERMSANDKAFTTSVSSLKLQLEEGAISQDEYDQQLQTLIDGYNQSNATLKAEIRNVELQIIGESYSDVLGDDAVADLNNALQYAIDNGLDPIEISDQQMADLLHINLEGNGETVSNIKDMLSGVFDQLGLIPVEVDGELYFKPTGESIEDQVDSQIPDAVDENVIVNVTGQKIIETMDQVLPEDFNIPETIDEDVVVKLNAAKTVQEQVDVLASEFGISNEEAETILWKLTGEKNIMNKISVTADDFGIPDSVSKTVSVNITPKSNLAGGSLYYGSPLFGIGFARGGIAGNIRGFSDGGIVRGGSQLIEVAEEGSPEMVIPLSSQRRGRALKLWAQAGNIMGVPGFARGGITSGGQDEGIRFQAYGYGEASGSGQTVQVDVGGITFEIHVEGSDPESIIEAVKEKAHELADMVAGIINEDLTSQYENTPAKGGAA